MLDLQILIQSLSGIQPSSQQLLYNGTVLQPTATLTTAGVRRHDMIQVLDTTKPPRQATVPRARPQSAGLGLQAPQMPQIYLMTPLQLTTQVHQTGFLPKLLQMDPDMGSAILANDMVKLGSVLT